MPKPPRAPFKPQVTAIDVAGRIPPHNLDAEAAVLSAIMLDGRELDKVSFLTPEHFYSEAHSRIYKAILELSGECKPIDIQTIAAWLRDREWLQAIGGVSMLARIVDATPAVAHLEAHGRIVEEKSKARTLIDACSMTIASAYSDYGSFPELLSGHTALIEPMAATVTDGRPVQMYDVIKSAFAVVESTPVGTGISALDALLRGGGLHPGQLVVIAAYPGVGKSALASGIVEHVASVERSSGEVVGGFISSMEMQKEELGQRMGTGRSGVDPGPDGANARGDDWDRYVSAMSELSRLPIWIDDTANISPEEFCAKARTVQREMSTGAKIGVGMYDYIQLGRGKGDSREQEVSSITRGLKAGAKRLKMPLIALSQLNRPAEANDLKRPQLRQLRESGGIEADADIIIFIHRPEWIEFKKNAMHVIPEVEMAEIIVAKQRGGRVGTAIVAFEGKRTKFRDATQMEAERWASARNGGELQKRQRPRYNPDD